jgi:glyoxylase-like metal-dependent hydrolase (beta-lactamase superfamily II)
MNEGYEIIQIDEGTWRIEDGMVRCYLLSGAEKALLIDTGMTLKNAREIAEGLTDRPVELLCTHGDPDHIAGNAAFPRFYMHPAEEDNYRTFGGPGELVPVRGGDVLELGDRALEVIELPGHTPGSIALLDRSRRALISGDPIQNGRIFMFGPGRDLKTYLKSLRRLQKRAGEFDAIWPAHGSFPVAPELIGALATGAERILAGQATWAPADMRGMPVRVYDVGCGAFLLPDEN